MITNLISRLKNAWWGLTRDTDCCECKPGLEIYIADLEAELEEANEEISRLNLENSNLKRELEFVE